ncbi:MAG: hypothetical protein GY696_19330 [Gammaproteobacteria bacterium]|nr:hypothetical protein [Gammaproteobacteria bacterium]
MDRDLPLMHSHWKQLLRGVEELERKLVILARSLHCQPDSVSQLCADFEDIRTGLQAAESNRGVFADSARQMREESQLPGQLRKVMEGVQSELNEAKSKLQEAEEKLHKSRNSLEKAHQQLLETKRELQEAQDRLQQPQDSGEMAEQKIDSSRALEILSLEAALRLGSGGILSKAGRKLNIETI